MKRLRVYVKEKMIRKVLVTFPCITANMAVSLNINYS